MTTARTPTVRSGADLPPLGFSGTTPYDPARFEAPRNELSASGKPAGGLWLAPLLDGDPPTTEWVAVAWDLWQVRLDTWPMTLAADARVLVVDCRADLADLVAAYPPPDHGMPVEVVALMDRLGGRGLDYEALAADYDALWLTADGVHDTRHGSPGLNTWDVESVLVLSAAAVAPVPAHR